MKFFIDITVMTRGGVPVGMINGHLELGYVPRVGELVSFSPPISEAPSLTGSFSGQIEVAEVMYSAGRPAEPPYLFFEPAMVETPEEGAEVLVYLEKGFGLWPIEFGKEELSDTT